MERGAPCAALARPEATPADVLVVRLGALDYIYRAAARSLRPHGASTSAAIFAHHPDRLFPTYRVDLRDTVLT